MAQVQSKNAKCTLNTVGPFFNPLSVNKTSQFFDTRLFSERKYDGIFFEAKFATCGAREQLFQKIINLVFRDFMNQNFQKMHIMNQIGIFTFIFNNLRRSLDDFNLWMPKIRFFGSIMIIIFKVSEFVRFYHENPYILDIILKLLTHLFQKLKKKSKNFKNFENWHASKNYFCHLSKFFDGNRSKMTH